MFSRSRILPVLLILLVFIVWKIRQNAAGSEKVSFNGQTMGTYYNIVYLDKDGRVYKKEVDSLLLIWNKALSTYIKDSEISRFNHTDDHYFESNYFYPVLLKSREIFEATGGAFDPTVMPLVNAWVFGPENEDLPDSSDVDRLLKLVSYDYIKFDSAHVWKTRKGVELDFSAIAKGYGVDVVGNFLSDKGIENYLVEIGGEITCRGINDKGIPWVTGIENPQVKFNERKLMAAIEVSDKSVATSGNYRNFYVVEGRKYAHTISPYTGYPVQHSLLSATVVADDCMTADGYATAFMVLGVEPSKNVLEKHPELEVYFIYSDENGNLNTYMTEGFKLMLRKDI